MISLIRQINKSQLRDERAWWKDGPTKEKVNKVVERQQKERQPKKPNPGQFQKGNKYAIKPAPKKERDAKKPVGPKKEVGGQVGIKRKGRLPSKMIINRAGKRQTVYYRPDKKTRSKYIKPGSMSTGQIMEGYKESFKRMLFFDHDNMENWIRQKGASDHAWGARMVEKLDKLADKYGFTPQNFDQMFNKISYGDFKGLDEFLQEAQNIYSELYKTGDRHPIDFINNIFDVTKQKISKHGNNRKNIEAALAKFNIYPVVNINNNGDQLNAKKGYAAAKNVPKNNPRPPAPAKAAANKDEEDKKAGAAPAAIPKKAAAGKGRNVKEVVNDKANQEKLAKFLKKLKK